MHSRVRDLEQLEEFDPDDRRRKLGHIVLALMTIAALAVAVGALVGKAAEGRSPGRDPLDQLDRVAAMAAAQRDDDSERPAPVKKPVAAGGTRRVSPAVEASQLTFERSLTEEEERPEVLAALEAAAREADGLGAGAAVAKAAPRARAASALAAPRRDPARADTLALALNRVEDEDPLAPAILGAQANVPAAVAAGAASRQLELARKHDKLIAALPAEPSAARAPLGKDGEFTLQVISYDSKAAAEAFASSLRARGHEAFVIAAEVEGRGRYFRVRLGPFKTKESAEEYRRLFEKRERMNTIVIKRTPELE